MVGEAMKMLIYICVSCVFLCLSRRTICSSCSLCRVLQISHLRGFMMVRILPYVGREAETWNDASMRKVVKVICYLSKHFVCVQVSVLCWLVKNKDVKKAFVIQMSLTTVSRVTSCNVGGLHRIVDPRTHTHILLHYACKLCLN